jgi:hypothetical protein
MADQHIGYPGSVNAAELADWMPNVAAAQYSVDGPNDAKVIVGSGTRAVTVKAGTIIGDGIMDVFESDTTLTLASVASGDRWDMIVLRRTWNATPGASTSVYTVVTGGPNKTLPSRNTNRGVLADQPIALVRVRSGQNTVQEIVDLRVWAHNGGVYGVDELVKNYLDQPGTHLTVNSTSWVRMISPSTTSNSAAWIQTGSIGAINLWGNTTGLDGGTPAGGSLFLIQAGTTVNTSDNSGYSRITWPRPFPNGLLTVMAFNGDEHSTGNILYASSGEWPWPTEGFGTRVSWVYSCMAATEGGSGPINRNGGANKLHRINWIAIGW